MTDYSLVIGVDAKHLRQLEWVWPTWAKRKPSLLKRPIIVFHDHEQVSAEDVQRVVQVPHLEVVRWPPPGVRYVGGEGKWFGEQRHKMLAGFVHVAARMVLTRYWLKLDTDVVATGMDDWADPFWFEADPAIVSHRWTFTKPPDQMMALDRWADTHRVEFPHGPLNLVPEPGSDRLSHRRIISWCAFFRTDFTKRCSEVAARTCGEGQMPVPSQDGFMWYCAKRSGHHIVTANMRDRGWSQWSTERNIKEHAREVLSCVERST